MNDELAKSIFFEAIENHQASEWAGFVDEAACSEEVRQRVMALLSAHKREHSVLGSAADPTLGSPEDTVGQYTLREVIGSGGFGVVFVGEQRTPVCRTVAVKVIKPGMDTKEVITRFEAERQALSMMEHPNVAKVLDAGTTRQGRPYFVMELVKGVSITEYCDEHGLTVAERLKLLIKVCHAVEHAHQKGIIHRDLKPTNILVADHDGEPVPKVIDFGVAKALDEQLTDKSLQTRPDQLVGTPLYMSPEQANADSLDVDTRADIYSIGVLMYELLTGTTPFDRSRLTPAGFDELRRIIREEEPPRPSKRLSSLADRLSATSERRRTTPSRLRQLVEGDLDWIVVKALEKDRGRRYQTANELANDIDRYLRNEPVQAAPPSATYRFGKFVTRNQAAVLTATVVALAIVLGTVSTTVGLWRASRALTREQAARDAGRANTYAYAMNVAFSLWYDKNLGRLSSTLDKWQPATHASGDDDLRGFEWYYLSNQLRLSQPTWQVTCVAPVRNVRFTLNGEQLAVGCRNGDVRLLDVRSAGKKQRPIFSIGARVQEHGAGVACTADGRYMAAVDGRAVQILNINTGRRLKTLQPGGNTISAYQMSDDGQLLATGDYSGNVSLWTIPEGTAVWQSNLDLPDRGRVLGLSFSPDRCLLAAARAHSGITIWKTATGASWSDEAWTATEQQLPVTGVAFSPDGTALAACSDPGIARWTITEDGLEDGIRVATPSFLNDIVFSPDSTSIATAAAEGTVTLWDGTSLTETKQLMHEAPVESVAFSPDGLWLASSVFGHDIYVWQLDELSMRDTIQGNDHFFLGLAFSPDGKKVVTGFDSDKVRVWDIEAQSLTDLPGPGGVIRSVSFSCDGGRLAAVTATGRTLVWRTDNTKTRRELDRIEGNLWGVAFSPIDRHLLATAGDGELRLRNLKTGKSSVLWQGDPTALRLLTVAFSPDGKLLACSGGAWDEFGETRVWDVSGSKPERVHTRKHPNIVYSVSIASDGRTLAATDNYRTGRIVVWKFDEKPEDARIIKAHAWHTSSVSISRTEPRLATAGADGMIRIWDLRTGQQLGTLRTYNKVRTVRFSPDGKRIVSASQDGTVRLW